MELAQIATEVFRRTIRLIEVEGVVERAISRAGRVLRILGEEIDPARVERVVVVAIGKAALPMAVAAGRMLGERLTAGIIATNESTGSIPKGFQLFTGGHPVPNEASLAAADAAIELLQNHNDERTLLLFLVSGGGSALFERPIDGSITLADLQEVNRVLVGCGAVIGEMNIVRRFLSAVKGGRLAAVAPRARQISLVISDVNHDDLGTVSSGPSLAGTTTRADFERVVERYQLLERFPASVAGLIRSGRLPDLPSVTRDTRRTCHLILDNRVALKCARELAEREYDCVVAVATDLVEGEIESMVGAHLARLSALREANPGRTVGLISGGEVICPVRGDGEGGRNQEFVLRAILASHFDQVAILSAGTDGIDGRSPAAGAVADQTTLTRALAAGLDPDDYLRRSDSYNFFARLGDAIITGPTGNNVRDLRLLLAR